MNLPILWGELTWEEIGELRDRGKDLVILPVGATEQHFLHLPVGVDTFWAPLRCGLENIRHQFPDLRIAL